MLDKTLRIIEKFIPEALYGWAQPIYHYKMALLGAIFYRFPGRKIKVVLVTGTKGKTSVTEMLSLILEKAGYKTAVLNTIRFKIADRSMDNLYKMSMPGRFFVQRFLRSAVNNHCDYAIIEATSEGARFFRHRFTCPDGFIFTNISPEHIESHGSYEKYVLAKVSIVKELGKSPKKHTVMVVNEKDKEAPRFLAEKADEKITFAHDEAEPYEIKKRGIVFMWDGIEIESPYSGLFNIENCLAAATFAKTQGVSKEKIREALSHFFVIRGRVEMIEAGQNFDVVVDYAHTPDSLSKFYKVFEGTRRICVLGNTGGGRDKWKRKDMAEIADTNCDHIILTNEDPYDEDPYAIVKEMASFMTKKSPEIIMNRREAIKRALSLAKKGDSVLITGKGTDPYIMGPKGSKTPWSDATVAKEEIEKILIG